MQRQRPRSVRGCAKPGFSLRETGFLDGQTVAIEYLWAEGHYDRLPALAAGLVERKVDVIVTGGPPATLAAKNATDDPNRPNRRRSGRGGFVASLARPGGNL